MFVAHFFDFFFSSPALLNARPNQTEEIPPRRTVYLLLTDFCAVANRLAEAAFSLPATKKKKKKKILPAASPDGPKWKARSGMHRA
jgi:hypothetical protein